jgi:tetratricopeptide (TPR) repeat protein
VKASDNSDHLIDYFHLLRSDTPRFLELCNEAIRQNPNDAPAYFTRHSAWSRLGRSDLALADLDRDIALSNPPSATTYQSRALVLRDLGRYREAIDDFNRAEALKPRGMAERPRSVVPRSHPRAAWKFGSSAR